MAFPQPITGVVAGYDPGGNGNHGVALLTLENGTVSKPVAVQTCATASDVLDVLLGVEGLIAIGIDTLMAWCTGHSGWRPADTWLRSEYSDVLSSVVSPNSLYGSMGLNGMAVAARLRQTHPDLVLCETHPKVLSRALTRERYDFETAPERLTTWLEGQMGHPLVCVNDHEWDAAVSAYAAWKGLVGKWTTDLFDLEDRNLLVFPVGADRVHYFWPDLDACG